MRNHRTARPKQETKVSVSGARTSAGQSSVDRHSFFLLKTGIDWEDLPAELGYGSGMTWWRRLRDWQKAGVREKIHKVLLSKLRQAEQIDFSRAVMDSASVQAVFGGRKQGQIPQIAAKKARSTIW